MATTFSTTVGLGMRGGRVTVSRGRTISRQPSHWRERFRNSRSVQFKAAPMPRVGWSRDDKVWRVPKLTSRSTVARKARSETWSAMSFRLKVGAGGGGARRGRWASAEETKRRAAAKATASLFMAPLLRRSGPESQDRASTLAALHL